MLSSRLGRPSADTVSLTEDADAILSIVASLTVLIAGIDLMLTHVLRIARPHKVSELLISRLFH